MMDSREVGHELCHGASTAQVAVLRGDVNVVVADNVDDGAVRDLRHVQHQEVERLGVDLRGDSLMGTRCEDLGVGGEAGQTPTRT